MTDAPPMFGPDFAAQFETLLEWRRDVRHFRTTPVPETEMQDLLRTAALAPSVGNAQPWRFVRLRSPEVRARLVDHVDARNLAAAAEQPDPERRDRYRTLKLHGLREAPEILAVLSDENPEAGHGLGIATMRETLRYSTVMAIHTLWLAARIRGIGMGWVSILDPQSVTAMLELPEHWSLIAILCIGYPEDVSTTPELERRDWQHREPVSDRIFER